mgnify:CR=1 FL=1
MNVLCNSGYYSTFDLKKTQKVLKKYLKIIGYK